MKTDRIPTREELIRLNPNVPEHLIPSQEELEESWIIYREFMAKYDRDHAVCPECGNRNLRTSLVQYAFYADRPEEYRDLNHCQCECGWRGTCHDRISEIEFKNK